MTVMVDTNIILDYVLERENFAETARKFIEHMKVNNYRAFLTASTVTDIHYLILRNTKNAEVTKNIIATLLNSFYVSSVSKTDCINALKTEIKDYEDSLLYVCAKKVKADYIITRNIKDFINSPIKAIMPDEFIKL